MMPQSCFDKEIRSMRLRARSGESAFRNVLAPPLIDRAVVFFSILHRKKKPEIIGSVILFTHNLLFHFSIEIRFENKDVGGNKNDKL